MTVAAKNNNKAPLVVPSAVRGAIESGIAASEKDFNAGRSFGPFKTHEAFIASLHDETAKLRAQKRARSAR